MNPITVARVYARLGVTSEQIACAPQITPQLRMIQKTIRRAGQPQRTRRVVSETDHSMIIEDTEHAVPYGPGSDLLASWPHYLASSDHADARKVLLAYHGLPIPLRKMSIPIEAYCVSASVSPSTILELIVAACVRFGAQASTIIASVNHPRIVEKSVEMALTDEGIEDRTLLAKATGFLPTPKGSQTTVNVAANASAQASTQAVIVAAPPPEQTIRKLTDRFNEARGLPPSRTLELPVAEDSNLPDFMPPPARERVMIPIVDEEEE